MGIKMKDIELDTMKTPSYPSGHSTQGYLIALALSDKYPNKEKKLMKAAKDISYSRRVARAHYKSDSIFGEQIGKDMYKHIKDKI
jgi:acid phosphatase (class A)